MATAPATAAVTAKINGIAGKIVTDWVRKYREDGRTGLENGKGWKSYSADLKTDAVKDVVVNGMSLNFVIKKYRISSDIVLRRWINSYIRGNKLETTRM